MRALTVRQPWAWAIFHGKDVENRSNWRYTYVGGLGIHAGLRLEGPSAFTRVGEWADDPMGQLGAPNAPADLALGAFIGGVNLLGAHWWQDCRDRHGAGLCSRWAERDQWHLELADQVVLPEVVECPGQLGLWQPPPPALNALKSVMF